MQRKNKVRKRAFLHYVRRKPWVRSEKKEKSRMRARREMLSWDIHTRRVRFLRFRIRFTHTHLFNVISKRLDHLAPGERVCVNVCVCCFLVMDPQIRYG
jgi:hypothetical protein